MPGFGVVRKQNGGVTPPTTFGGGWARGGARGLPPRVPPAA